MFPAPQAVCCPGVNFITLHNVVAASATFGLLAREGLIIRKTLLPMTYYVAGAGALGMALIYSAAWLALWAAVVAGSIAFMWLNRGRPPAAVPGAAVSRRGALADPD
jgi:lactate permease